MTQVVVWPKNATCERKWLLDNAPGATAILVMLTEKVREIRQCDRLFILLATPFAHRQVNAELCDAAGPSLRIVSTMSVGYGAFT